MATKLKMMNLKSFTSQHGKSILDGMKTYELLEPSILNSLLNSDLLKTTKWTRDEWGYDIELENEKDQIKKIYQKVNSSKSKVKCLSVSYSQNKSIKMGRVYPLKSLSLCSIRKEVRHTLANEMYHDIDIENCHPNLLRQVCQEEGIDTPYLKMYCEKREECLKSIQQTYKVERGVAKNLVIRICYGGEFSSWCQDNDVIPDCVIDWVEGLTNELNTIGDICWERNPHLHKLKDHKRNPKRSGLSYFAQDLENRILEVMFHCLVKNKIIKKNRKGEYGCVLCFDGIMIERDNVEIPIEDLCMKLRAFVLEHSGFDLTFTEKSMNEGFDIDNLDDEDDGETVNVLGFEHNRNWLKKGVETDLDAGEKVFEIYPLWKYREEEENLYVFDRDTGLWTASKMTHKKIISELAPYLRVIKGDGELGKKSYGNTKALMEKVFDFLSTKCIDDAWFKQKENSSLGYVLHSNGYVDMLNGKFYPKDQYGFNPDILFFGRIPRPFVSVEKEDIDALKKRLFTNALGEEQGNYMALYFARALAGDIKMKQTVFGVGVGNSGKGTITKLALLALGDYCSTFNAGCLAYSKSSNDEAQKLRWMKLIAHCRLIISNEVSSDAVLDGNMLKKMASGGDSLVAREHSKNETEFVPHFSSLTLANDLSKIVPYDDAVDNRVKVCSFDKAFVDDPTNEFELKKDDEFVASIQKQYTQDCFVNMLYREYTDFVDGGCIMNVPESVNKAKQDWVGESKSAIDTFKNEFEITNDKADFVSNDVIEDFLKSSKTGVSIRKFNKEMKMYASLSNFDNVKVSVKKMNGKAKRGFVGIKSIEQVEEE